MKSGTRIALVSLTLLLIGTLLAGCGSSSLKIGWRGTSGLERKRASYTTFDGVQRKTFRAKARSASSSPPSTARSYGRKPSKRSTKLLQHGSFDISWNVRK